MGNGCGLGDTKMRIKNVWSLHYERFLITIEGTDKEAFDFANKLKKRFDDKVKFVIINETNNKTD